MNDACVRRYFEKIRFVSYLTTLFEIPRRHQSALRIIHGTTSLSQHVRGKYRTPPPTHHSTSDRHGAAYLPRSPSVERGPLPANLKHSPLRAWFATETLFAYLFIDLVSLGHKITLIPIRGTP